MIEMPHLVSSRRRSCRQESAASRMLRAGRSADLTRCLLSGRIRAPQKRRAENARVSAAFGGWGAQEQCGAVGRLIGVRVLPFLCVVGMIYGRMR